MSTRARYKQFLVNRWAFCFLILSALLAVGCGDSSDSTSSNQTQTQSRQPAASAAEHETDLIAATEFQQKLIGVWFGEAFLDEARLMEKIQSLSDQQRDATLRLAEEFLSTAMAIDFRADGSLETEVEVTRIDSQPIRDGGAGNWRVVETVSDAAVVETITRLADGSTITDQKRYEFGADRDRVVVVVDLGDELDGCDSAIVLHRQPVISANVAEQASQFHVK